MGTTRDFAEVIKRKLLSIDAIALGDALGIEKRIYKYTPPRSRKSKKIDWRLFAFSGRYNRRLREESLRRAIQMGRSLRRYHERRNLQFLLYGE